MKLKSAVLVLTVFFTGTGAMMPQYAFASHTSECEITSPITADHATEGYNRDPDVVSSVGDPLILALAIDFTDAKTPDSSVSAISKIVNLNTVENFYRYISEGKFRPTFRVFPEVVTMPEPSTHYGNQLDADTFTGREWQSQHLVREALISIQKKLVISNYSAVVVFVTGGKSLSGYVGLTTLNDPPYLVFENGEVHNFTVIGAGITRSGDTFAARVLVHEVGHLIGLPDLYSYDPNGFWMFNSPSNFSTMGTLQGSESDSLAWNRFILKWMDDKQVYCASQTPLSESLKLSTISKSEPSSFQLVLIKRSTYKILAIESIPRVGFFSKSQTGGFLVYEVDTSKSSGSIPIKIIPRVTTTTQSSELPDWVRLAQAPLISDSYLVYEGIRLENELNADGSSQLHIYSGPNAIEASRRWEVNHKITQQKIACVRGRSKRTLVGTNLKCPRGYSLQIPAAVKTS